VRRGTVVKVTRRVIEAINAHLPEYIRWPDQERRKEISQVLKEEGFEGCVGFVDGTTIPLYQRPVVDGKVYWDRKKQYSINCQIVCDCNKYITACVTGWPGSYANSTVFKKPQLHHNPKQFFDAGE
jgi:hypothetical protein